MTTPTLYSVCYTSDGQVAVMIEDGPFVAIGEADLLTLSKFCDIAIGGVNRQKEVERVRREMECEQRCMETLRKVDEAFGSEVKDNCESVAPHVEMIVHALRSWDSPVSIAPMCETCDRPPCICADDGGDCESYREDYRREGNRNLQFCHGHEPQPTPEVKA